MAFVFDLLLNVFLLASFVVFFVLLFVLVFTTTNDVGELFIRALAVFAGALVILGARAADLSYAEYMIEVLSGVRPVPPAIEGLLTIIPGAVGVAMGWYITHLLSKNDPRAVRVIGLVGMLAIASFAHAYLLAFDTNGLEIGKLALPNVLFVTGLVLWIVFKYPYPGQRSRRSATSSALRDRLRTALRSENTPDENA